jgi:excinuclease ABC subunit A
MSKQTSSDKQNGVFDTDVLSIRGAREHNLKNVDLDIPKNKFVVFTGIS